MSARDTELRTETVFPETATSEDTGYAFGPFILYAESRRIYRQGEAIVLGGRGFDILALLLSQAGRFVPNDALLRAVWPTTAVGEANLRVQIAALRRALNEKADGIRYIQNVTGRGYRIGLDVQRMGQTTGGNGRADEPVATGRTNLPPQMRALIGRSMVTTRLREHLHDHRLVTLVGPGGIGKTSIAINVASEMRTFFPDGVWFIDLATLSDPGLIVAAVLKDIDEGRSSQDAGEVLLETLRDKVCLLLFDNCEHLLDAVACLLQDVLSACPQVCVLATSREALRLEAEKVFPIRPLDVPAPADDLSRQQIFGYAAVQLFAERARAGDLSLAFSDRDTAAIARICHKLDGIPLAVELAAARLNMFGAEGLLRQIEDNLLVLNGGRRVSTPRHQTLDAMLDWSYALLTPVQRALLQCLSIFRGEFSLDAALAVCDEADDSPQAIQTISELVSKSWMTIDTRGSSPVYRMLYVTRAYVAQRLTLRSDACAVGRRHAVYLLRQLREMEHRAADPDDTPDWFSRHVDDVRAALQWAFSATGEPRLGIELTEAALRPGLRLQLLKEYERHIDRALSCPEDLLAVGPIVELKLLSARFSVSIMMSADRRVVLSFSRRIIDLIGRMSAAQRHEVRFMEPLNTLCGRYFGGGDYPRLLVTAQAALAEAENEGVRPEHLVFPSRMAAMALHFLGRFDEAAIASERLLRVWNAGGRRHTAFHDLVLDPRSSAQLIAARAQWLQGHPQMATRSGEEALALTRPGIRHFWCMMLGFGVIPVAVWRGQIAVAEAWCERLSEAATEYGLMYWSGWGDVFTTAISALKSPEAVRPDWLSPFRHPAMDGLQADFLATVHPLLCGDEAIERVLKGSVGWNAAEVHRIMALRLLEGQALPPFATFYVDAVGGAEGLLRKAVDIARLQRARGWELRALTSAVRHTHTVPADELAAVLAHFADASDDRDVVAARAVLGALPDKGDNFRKRSG